MAKGAEGVRRKEIRQICPRKRDREEKNDVTLSLKMEEERNLCHKRTEISHLLLRVLSFRPRTSDNKR